MSATEIPEVMPVDWNGTPDGLQVSLSMIDEYSLPIDRRGIKTKVPNDPAEFEKFADAVAATVRATVILVLKNRTGVEL